MIGHLKENARKETKLPNDGEIDTSRAMLSCPKSGLAEDSRWWEISCLAVSMADCAQSLPQ